MEGQGVRWVPWCSGGVGRSILHGLEGDLD